MQQPYEFEERRIASSVIEPEHDKRVVLPAKLSPVDKRALWQTLELV
jgi:hypothetical protein